LCSFMNFPDGLLGIPGSGRFVVPCHHGFGKEGDQPYGGGDCYTRGLQCADLRALARVSRDPRQCRRLLALAAVAEGRSRAEAAEISGMDRQALRDWPHRFNGEGPEGLLDRKTDGPPPKLTATGQLSYNGAIIFRGLGLILQSVVRVSVSLNTATNLSCG
jgi:hypothetical protein